MISRRNFFSNAGKTALVFPFFSIAPSLLGKQTDKHSGLADSIQTMNGPVPISELGLTLIHEHLLFGTIPEEKEKESVAHAVKLIKDAERVGVQTILDLTPMKNIRLLQEIASQVSLNIIVSTGSYQEKFMTEEFKNLSPEQYKDYLRKELTTGIEDTKIKAGIIKVAASGTPMTPWERKVFKAAAEVQHELKARIGTHATHNPGDQFDWLVQNGADPTKLFFSHTEAKFGWGGKNREEMGQELLRIARAGGSMLFNNFGYEFDTPWEDLVYLIKVLCDNGCRNRVLTSIDCYWKWVDGKIQMNVENRHPDTARRTYSYMVTDTIPALLKAGFSAKDIHTFLIENPANFLS